jgi:4a-hydroxytetrahydrobiopterin dehydratase
MPPLGREDLRDTLSQLQDWVCDAREIKRSMRLDESEHAALAERIKVVADALELRPDVRRLDGYTQVSVRCPEGQTLTDGEVRLAARIEAAYRTVIRPSR